MNYVLRVKVWSEHTDTIKTFSELLAEMHFQEKVEVLAKGTKSSRSGEVTVFIVKVTDEAKTEIVNTLKKPGQNRGT